MVLYACAWPTADLALTSPPPCVPAACQQVARLSPERLAVLEEGIQAAAAPYLESLAEEVVPIVAAAFDAAFGAGEGNRKLSAGLLHACSASIAARKGGRSRAVPAARWRCNMLLHDCCRGRQCHPAGGAGV